MRAVPYLGPFDDMARCRECEDNGENGACSFWTTTREMMGMEESKLQSKRVESLK